MITMTPPNGRRTPLLPRPSVEIPRGDELSFEITTPSGQREKFVLEQEVDRRTPLPGDANITFALNRINKKGQRDPWHLVGMTLTCDHKGNKTLSYRTPVLPPRDLPRSYTDKLVDIQAGVRGVAEKIAAANCAQMVEIPAPRTELEVNRKVS